MPKSIKNSKSNVENTNVNQIQVNKPNAMFFPHQVDIVDPKKPNAPKPKMG